MNQRESHDPARDRRQFFNRFRPTAFQRRRIEQKPGCLGCGACVRGCESGALSCDFTRTEMIKSWDGERCQRCGKCIQRCPSSLLNFVTVELGMASAGKCELLRLGVVFCPGCGIVIRKEDGPVCITCRRRGMFS